MCGVGGGEAGVVSVEINEIWDWSQKLNAEAESHISLAESL